MIIKTAKSNAFQWPTCRGVRDTILNGFAMHWLRCPVNSLGCTLARKVVAVIPRSFFTNRGLNEVDADFSILGIPGVGKSECTPIDTMVVTVGMCSQMLFYGAFYSAVCSFTGPVEGWGTLPLLLGPWWSSSYWAEWLCYDFVLSTISAKEKSLPIVDVVTKIFPYDNHPALHDAYKNHKRCFYFCAMLLLVSFAIVYQIRPAASNILMTRAYPFFQHELGSVLTAGSLLFQNGFDL